MQIKLLFFISLFFCATTIKAQYTPLEMKYKAWGLHALRQYPFSRKAEDIVSKMIAQDSSDLYLHEPYLFHKTTLDMVVNTQFIGNVSQAETSEDAILQKYILKYYSSWLKYGQPINNKPTDLALTFFLEQAYKNGFQKTDSVNTIFKFIDSENLSYLLKEWTGDINLSKKSQVLSVFVKSPIAKNAMETYQYYLSGVQEIDGIPVYEIAFFSKKPIDNTFEGFLYVSTQDYSLLKAIFTLNYYANHKGLTEMLFTHTPSKRENLFYFGSDDKAGLLLNRTTVVYDSLVPPIPLTPSEKEISGLIEEADRTRAYRNLQKTGILLATDKFETANGKWEFGQVSHSIHYNPLEGLRLRIGGNTTWKLNRHVQTGGYLAYGFGDKQWKYRGDMWYSHNRNDQFHFTYVQDLNILGYNLLDDQRDHFLNSFSRSGLTSMSLQKIGQINYEKNFLQNFSAQLTVKYAYDEPLGKIYYEREAFVNQPYPFIKNAEWGLSARYAPNEKFVRLRNNRLVFQNADFDLSLSYRMGVKGIFGSGYNYKITSFDIYKKIYLPYHIGDLKVRLSGGKVWDRVPFPLLFIPAGNQFYFFTTEDYNLMNFAEFLTDRYVSGNFSLAFNWSPINIVYSRSKIRTNFGLKTIYGPLSDNNNPQNHPELFVFNNGIRALGTDPYIEANVGLGNILKVLRIDYVQRLTYQKRGSFFVAFSFDF